MNRHVNAIAGRLSLRPPQRRSLEILDRITELVPPKKGADVAYDQHADLLYDLAGQVVSHLRSYLSEEEAGKVLRYYQRDIARFVHSQMGNHYWENAVDYDVNIKGFTELKPSAYTISKNDSVMDFRQPPDDKSNMAKYLFGGFKKCIYAVQKFQSDPERKLAVILDRDGLKWFRPATGQFQIIYRSGNERPEYLPDFVVESPDFTYMLECKKKSEMGDPEVQAKKEVATRWCKLATEYAAKHGGKPWKYVLIPHDAISENMTLAGLADHYVVSLK